MYALSTSIDLCGAVLPDALSPNAPALLNTVFRARCKAHGTAVRRGVIVMGHNIDRYRAFFMGVGIPVYLYVTTEQVDVPEDSFRGRGQLE